MATRELTVSGGSFDTKERVKQAVDIVDLVGSHIQLRRQGRNYVGLCPWHDDTRPSLQVNPERQSFKCWVCDIGGDVFSFVMKIEGVEFREALDMLADRAGITVDKPPRRLASGMGETARGEGEAGDGLAAGAQNKRTLMQAMAWAEKQYHRCLLDSPEAEPARRYLQERGITAESIERFHLGFSPPERAWILRGAQSSSDQSKLARRAKVLETVGILARPAEGGSPYDRFKGRLLFSIHDAQGRPVGIGGRVLPATPEGDSPIFAAQKLGQSPAQKLGQSPRAKYINSPETPLFTKSKLLYGLDLAREELRKTRTALVMEGYTDVIVAHQYGFQNAVAVLGTALGESHVRLLKAHADRIVLVLDGDEAGTRRANEVLELFITQQADLRILTVPEGLDPCDFLQQYGAAAFAQLLATKAVDALDHAFEITTRGIDVQRDVHGASQAIERLLGIVARAPRLSDQTRGDARIQEQKIVQRLAGKFRVDESDLRRRLAALRRRSTTAPQPRAATSNESQAMPNAATDPWESAVLQLIVAHPESFAAIRGRIAPERIAGSSCRQIYETCCRLADEGLSPEFGQLMLEFDEPAIKSLLVGIDEVARATGQPAADPDLLLNGLTETLERKEVERKRPACIGALREGGLDDEAQKSLVLAAIQQERSRQGISDPTDG
jgi:DNA primase